MLATRRRWCQSGANCSRWLGCVAHWIKPNVSLVALGRFSGSVSALLGMSKPPFGDPPGRWTLDAASPLCSSHDGQQRWPCQQCGPWSSPRVPEQRRGWPRWDATEHGNGQHDGDWRTRGPRADSQYGTLWLDRKRQRPVRLAGRWRA